MIKIFGAVYFSWPEIKCRQPTKQPTSNNNQQLQNCKIAFVGKWNNWKYEIKLNKLLTTNQNNNKNRKNHLISEKKCKKSELNALDRDAPSKIEWKSMDRLLLLMTVDVFNGKTPLHWIETLLHTFRETFLFFFSFFFLFVINKTQQIAIFNRYSK